MSTPSRFNDKEYKNWLRCNLALIQFKKGLHDFIKTEVANFHAHIQQKIANIPCRSSVGSHCGSCTWKSIKYTVCQEGIWHINCQNKICDKWLSQILLEHNDPQNRNINWKNADISKWPTDGYEVVKVYMPKGQDRLKNLPDDFDVTAVLSLLKNCTWFTQKIQTTSIVSDLINIRNELMNSGDLRVTDSKMNSCIDKIMQLLSELNIHGDVCTELLKVGDIDVNNREIEVRALQSLISSIEEQVNSLKHAPIQQRQDIEEVKGIIMEPDENVASMETDIQVYKLKVTKLRINTRNFKSFLVNNPDINEKIILENIQAVESKFEKICQETERKLALMEKDMRRIAKGMKRLTETEVKAEEKHQKRGQRLSKKHKILKRTPHGKLKLLYLKRKRFSTNSEHLNHLSRQLSSKLKSHEMNEKLSVWPGIDLAERRTVFVCVYQGDMQKSMKLFKGIYIHYRDADRPSRLLEPPHNMPIDSELNLSKENAELLKRAIEEHGPDLFKQHTNLEAITGSSYILSKSKGYIKCPSVVLYCRVKGIVPIDEVEFPKYLKVGDEEEIVYIDVREGYFMHGMYKESKFCTTDWHDELRMGTSIGVADGDQGTLGPIVKISNTDFGFVTCAHVILPDPRDESALQQSIGLKVYQPADNESHAKCEKPRNVRYCGKVLKIVFNPAICDPVNGLFNTVGVDAALVIVEGKRRVDIGSFPFIPDKDLKNAGFEPTHPPEFRHGSVAKYPLNFKEILGKRVIKYGRTTGLTRGTVGLDGTMVRIEDSFLKVPRTKEMVLMKGQYTVEGTGRKSFFQPGDSGSGVFLLDEKNKLTCIGLAIGYIHDWWDTYTVVTPITYVLKALGLPLESMHFEKVTAVQDITTSRTSFDPAISPSRGIERRSQRKRKANQTSSYQDHHLSLSSPSPEKKKKN